ncbi:hypothetical protein KEJ49_03260 [Candidatus Bathyarchaeota archaeon]|nr:hypothetical protein [Candidatus Bathyarchaeota archaeon]
MKGLKGIGLGNWPIWIILNRTITIIDPEESLKGEPPSPIIGREIAYMVEE